MSSMKVLSDQLRMDGIQLDEKQLELVQRFLTRLAKIEYESYLQRKKLKSNCQSTDPQDIGTKN